MKITNRVKCKGCGKYIGYYKDLGTQDVAEFRMRKVELVRTHMTHVKYEEFPKAKVEKYKYGFKDICDFCGTEYKG